MGSRVSLVSCVALLGLAAVGRAQFVSQTSLSNSLGQDGAYVDNAQFQILPGSQGAVIEASLNGLWASIGQKYPSPVSWAGSDAVSMTITNLEAREVRLGFRLDATADPTDGANIEKGGFMLRAGETRTIVYDLDYQAALNLGMRARPPLLSTPHARLISWKNVDLSNVYGWVIYNRDAAAVRIRITNVEVGGSARPSADYVDAFGQYRFANWPNKVSSASDIQQLHNGEMADLALNPSIVEADGTIQIPRQAATGRWRVAKLPSGKFYLVHPNGKPFWSYGITCVNPTSMTITGGREHLFNQIPNQGESAQFASWITDKDGAMKPTFDFFSHNQYLKYGAAWRAQFRAQALRRLKSWGFNTLGQWSDPALLVESDLPYTIRTSTNTFGTRLRVPFAHWGDLPDAYAPGFESWLADKFTVDLGSHNGRDTFMGVFVDGEMSWGLLDSRQNRYQIALAALRSASSQPAKREFVRQLESRYRRIGSLNRAWGTNYASWSALRATTTAPANIGLQMEGDFRRFVHSFASAYYAKVARALQTAGSTGLYLGSADVYQTPETVSAAMPYVDVYSVTLYADPSTVDWTFPQITKPVMISEFAAGSTDRGSFHHGPVGVMDQLHRAAYLRTFVQSALQSPKVVGAHWFQYTDQPITGRWNDGENYNMGFVSAADSPFQEMVEASRQVGRAMYGIRGS